MTITRAVADRMYEVWVACIMMHKRVFESEILRNYFVEFCKKEKDNFMKELKVQGITIEEPDYLAKAKKCVKNADKFLTGDITIGESHYQLELAIVYFKEHITHLQKQTDNLIQGVRERDKTIHNLKKTSWLKTRLRRRDETS
jgi:hypothetical protein